MLVDTRTVDGRLFTIATDAWLQWASLLLQVGFAATASIDVFIKGVAATRGRPLLLSPGDLISIMPRGCMPDPMHTLSSMLMRASLWSRDPPDLHPSGADNFLLLTDGLPRLFQVDRDVISNSEAFRCAAGEALECQLDTVSCKPSIPRITNSMFLGTPSMSVVLVTTRLSRVPVPPGRLLPRQAVVFLDLRPILQVPEWDDLLAS